MTYFNSRDVAMMSICAALWAILNMTVTPIFWQLTRTPFICDMLAVISLVFALWWTRKFGTVTATGLIATLLTLMLRPGALQFLGFTAASVIFEFLAKSIGYSYFFENPRISGLSLILFSTISTAIAGLIIGYFFMGFYTSAALLFFAGLHAVGGAIGGGIGLVLIRALEARRASPPKTMAR